RPCGSAAAARGKEHRLLRHARRPSLRRPARNRPEDGRHRRARPWCRECLFSGSTLSPVVVVHSSFCHEEVRPDSAIFPTSQASVTYDAPEDTRTQPMKRALIVAVLLLVVVCAADYGWLAYRARTHQNAFGNVTLDTYYSVKL